MSKIVYPTSEKLRFVLESMHNHEVAFPNSQSDFDWDPRATEESIESTCQSVELAARCAARIQRNSWTSARS